MAIRTVPPSLPVNEGSNPTCELLPSKSIPHKRINESWCSSEPWDSGGVVANRKRRKQAPPIRAGEWFASLRGCEDGMVSDKTAQQLPEKMKIEFEKLRRGRDRVPLDELLPFDCLPFDCRIPSRGCLRPMIKPAEFARFVGMRTPHHFSEVLRGRRPSCSGWSGGILYSNGPQECYQDGALMSLNAPELGANTSSLSPGQVQRMIPYGGMIHHPPQMLKIPFRAEEQRFLGVTPTLTHDPGQVLGLLNGQTSHKGLQHVSQHNAPAPKVVILLESAGRTLIDPEPRIHRECYVSQSWVQQQPQKQSLSPTMLQAFPPAIHRPGCTCGENRSGLCQCNSWIWSYHQDHPNETWPVLWQCCVCHPQLSYELSDWHPISMQSEDRREDRREVILRHYRELHPTHQMLPRTLGGPIEPPHLEDHQPKCTVPVVNASDEDLRPLEHKPRHSTAHEPDPEAFFEFVSELSHR